MKNLFRNTSFIFLTTTIISCGIFRNYSTITTKPENFYSSKIYAPDTSLISLDLKVDYKSLEAKVNQLFSKPYTDNGTGEFDKQYRAKSKNPVYDPIKWIKTRDPFYHKNKWIKIKIFGKTIKTKDPRYHPRKWIKTKNPKYNPNKWIYANAIRVQVGYKYEYTIKKRRKIKFLNLGKNTLRIIVPLDVEGSVGFKGDGAKLLSLTKKNIKSKIDFYIDTDISFNPDWCPNVNTKISHKWVSDPKIEVSGGVWLGLKLPLDLLLKQNEKEIEDEVKSKINCNKIKKSIAQWTKPSSTNIPEISKDLFLNINPKSFYLSDLYVDKSNLNIKFGAKVLMNISTEKEFKVSSVNDLPKLEKYSFDRNLVTLSVPIKISYDKINDTLNTALSTDSMIFKEDSMEVKINEFEIYPSGERLTIGIDLSAKFPRKILSTKGKVYLTAKPNITKDRLFELQDFEFSAKLDNQLYPVLGALFTKKITDFIYQNTKYDLKPEFEKAEKLIESKVAKELSTINNIQIETDKISFDVPSIDIGKNELIVPIRLATGVRVQTKNVW